MPILNLNFNQTIKGRFTFCLFLSLAYLFPLLSSGHYYADDLLHSVVGETPWISNGRPLADALMHLLMAGGFLNDIAPLTQILGAAIISVTIAKVSFRISKVGINFPVISLFPIVSSPFFLENWSFRYDSLTMACAVSASIAPFALKSDSIIRSTALSLIMIFISMCFYQAAINIFISLSVIFFLTDTLEGRDSGKYKEVFGRVIGLTIATFIYSVTIKAHLVTGEYNISHSRVASGGITDIINIIIVNYNILNDIFLSAFSGNLYIYFLPQLILTISLTLLVIKRVISNGRPLKCKLVDLFFILLGLAVIYASVFGPLLLLRNPVFSPRVMIGASGILVFMTISTFMLTKELNYIKWINIIPIAGMFILAYSYYNAQRTTDLLEANMVTEIKTAIALSGRDAKGIAFKGTAPRSMQSILAEKNFPIIGRIIFNNLNQDFLWGKLKLESFGLQIPYISFSEEETKICDMKIIGDFGNYTLLYGGDYYVVDYDKETCIK